MVEDRHEQQDDDDGGEEAVACVRDGGQHSSGIGASNPQLKDVALRSWHRWSEVRPETSCEILGRRSIVSLDLESSRILGANEFGVPVCFFDDRNETRA